MKDGVKPQDEPTEAIARTVSPAASGDRPAEGGLEQFLADIQPFFHGRKIVYVDVGAFEGSVFAALLETPLAVREAHLFEPNPLSFSQLRQIANDIPEQISLSLYNIAVGDIPGKVTMKAARTMTRVIDSWNAEQPGTEISANTFEVECRTLDSLTTRFSDGRISILKVDVEGFEKNVFAGARDLLSAQKVDVIYVEVGADPSGTQQIYFRDIDDILLSYGYKIFRIYEQKNQWMEDSPLLRRMNIAYMSARFAEGHPYRLTKKIFELEERRNREKAESAALRKLFSAREKELERQIDKLEIEVETLRKNLHEIEAKFLHEKNKTHDLRVKLKERDTQIAALQGSHNETEIRWTERLADRMAEIERQTSDLQSVRQALTAALASVNTLDKALKDRDSRIETLEDALIGSKKRILDYRDYSRESSVKLKERLAKKKAENRDEKAELRSALRELRAMRRSTSWKVTAPLRAMGRVFGREKVWPASATAVSGRTFVKISETSEGTDGSLPARLPPMSKAASQFTPQQLEAKLWGGYSELALAELEALKLSDAPQKSVIDAAWALACWYTAERDYERGIANAALARQTASPRQKLTFALVEAYCHVLHGNPVVGRAVLSPFIESHAENPNLLLALANTASSEDERLARINRVLSDQNFLPLAKRHPELPLTSENLTTPEPNAIEHEAKVSIIIPVFNARDTIGFTLDSLIRQSWRNLEILLVDDCSGDDTRAILHSFAAKDPRIHVFRQDENLGAYCARNRGLSASTGSFITVHDAGDWSHPQKIEIQATHLLANPNIIGNHTRWARALDNLVFSGKFRRKDKILDWNPSSFFFRRELTDRIGGWDAVRISADAEFVRRAKLSFGEESIVAVMDGAPLSFGSDDPSSLTKMSATHGRTIYHGLRREYREASDHWHETADKADLHLAPNDLTRPFPVSASILPRRVLPINCDVFYVGDFGRTATRDQFFLHLHEALEADRTVAVFHWPHYGSDVTLPLHRDVRQLAFEGKVHIIAPGEVVKTSIVVVGSPSALDKKIDLFPTVDFDSLYVLRETGDDQDAEKAARHTLGRLLGTEGAWIDPGALRSILQRPL